MRWEPRSLIEDSTGRACLRRAGILAACLLFCLAVQAAPKTDVVELTNGDRLTGEIKKLNQGLLTLSTDALDTVYIKWENVRALRTKQFLQVESRSGQRHFGSAPEERPAHIEVIDVEKGKQEWLPLAEVIRIDPIERGQLLNRLSGNFSMGYDFTKASDVGTFTFDGQLSSRTQAREWQLDGSGNLTSQTGPNATTYDVSASYSHFLARRMYYIGRLRFESNSEFGLDLRTSVGGGLGHFLKQDPHQEWAAVVGLAVNDERYAGEPRKNSVDAFIGTTYSYYRFYPLNADIDFALALLPSLTESGRLRSDADLDVRWEIVNNFYFEISLYGKYDSQPGVEANSEYDYGTTTSIGYSF